MTTVKRNDNRPRKPRPPRPPDPYDGLLLVDKPAGLTSHDVVARIRRVFGFRKVGHGGTLDPMATGLLLILIGRGTKLSQYVMGTDKTYEGTMRLGISTDSHDVDGAILAERDAGHVTREMLLAEMEKWLGDIMQTPPMVSAIKHDGVPLYKLARKGKTVERKPRLLHVYDFALLDYAPPLARFRLHCTKGTYVRTLCADVGEGLGCGAFLEQLRRTEVGSYRLEDAAPLADLIELSREQLQERLRPLHEVRTDEPG